MPFLDGRILSSMQRAMPSEERTKGQVEAAITEAITRFERDYLGRGPKEARTFIIEDLVVVRLQGILSPAEQQLSHESGGVDLIKQMRSRLIESTSHELCNLVVEETGTEVVSMHTDISARTGERVFLFSMAEDLQAMLEP
jgi:uncharacterized protein YbcI